MERTCQIAAPTILWLQSIDFKKTIKQCLGFVQKLYLFSVDRRTVVASLNIKLGKINIIF